VSVIVNNISGWGTAVFVGSAGWEAGVVVPRAARGFGSLVGGLAGIATSVADNAMVLEAILDSPYPDTSRDGDASGHQGAW
jgi:hypothetical protein